MKELICLQNWQPLEFTCKTRLRLFGFHCIPTVGMKRSCLEAKKQKTQKRKEQHRQKVSCLQKIGRRRIVGIDSMLFKSFLTWFRVSS